MCRKAGLAGVVCSAQEAAAIKVATNPEFMCLTPGIRPAGSDAGDQNESSHQQKQDKLVLLRLLSVDQSHNLQHLLILTRKLNKHGRKLFNDRNQ